MDRHAFLTSSGSALLLAAPGGASALPRSNIIIPGRGATSYLKNIPAWTPKAALEHPLTISLNHVPRFTSEALRLRPNLAKALRARVRPTTLPCPLTAGDRYCNPDPSDPPTPYFTSANALSAPSYYVGRRFVGPHIPQPVDGYGAHFSGAATSATSYGVRAFGQNETYVYAGTLPNFGHGTFQYGTTTITVHPTLPMVRWTDPTFGSGVAYYHAATQRMVFGHTDVGNNSYAGFHVGYPTAAPNQGTWVDLGLFGFFTGIAVVGILLSIAAVPVLGVAAVASGFAFAVLGLAASIFGLIRIFEGTPQLPPAPSVSLDNNSADLLGGAPYDGGGPPDGLGTTGEYFGAYPDGGGGDGSDSMLLC